MPPTIAPGRSRHTISATDELEFIQHHRTGTVHVVRPPSTEQDGPTMTTAGLDPLIAAGRGTTLTLCGFVAHQHAGRPGDQDELVLVFPDERLCASCYRALGERRALAFEHPQTEEDL